MMRREYNTKTSVLYNKDTTSKCDWWLVQKNFTKCKFTSAAFMTVCCMWPWHNGNNIGKYYLPTFIHFLGSRSPWWHFLYSGSGWLSCLLHTWRINEFHFAIISASKPALVDVVHQYTCLRIPFIQSLMISHPFSLLNTNSVFVPDVEIMLCIGAVFPNPLGNPSMTVWHEYGDWHTEPL